ncbi:DNA-binding protein [Flavobacterium davisii]|uniref:DNA-binding protein n=1 Tax=Flavobacterium davisii TaxID=2906077 RepID=A0A246GKY8_9FLAO|nr:helix-turn-helix domain-containing protein [Flavobacterium davisii]OWP85003.1 DNA-binding protein [Flavobacterium davisii]
MEAIQITQTNANDFKIEILKGVKIQIDELKSQFQPKAPNEYLTRQEVAKMFSVDISTVHNWCKSKKINPLGLGSRVYFLRSEIEASLTPLNV